MHEAVIAIYTNQMAAFLGTSWFTGCVQEHRAHRLQQCCYAKKHRFNIRGRNLPFHNLDDLGESVLKLI